MIPFYNNIRDVLSENDYRAEIIFVDDGSVDKSSMIIENIIHRDNRVRLIRLSRNFGHESAMIAGIDNCSGDAIIAMDSDLQHPPSLINEMIDRYKEGYDIVLMKRKSGKLGGGGYLQHLFYKAFNQISKIKLEENASDFFLISARIAEILKTDIRERTRFIRGLIQWCGYNRTVIEFNTIDRKYGKSKYSPFKLIDLSLDALFSFSTVPLTLIIYAGLGLAGFAFLYLLYAIMMKLCGNSVEGWASLLAMFSLLSGFHLVAIGALGKYIGIILQETKQRPIYLIQDRLNFQDEK